MGNGAILSRLPGVPLLQGHKILYDEDFDSRFQKTMVGALTRIVRGAGGQAEFDDIVDGIKPIYGKLRKPDGARCGGRFCVSPVH